MNEKTVFLSHHSSKRELVAHVARYLEKNDIHAWYAPRDIRSGEEWDEAIHEAIRTCTAVVLLFCAQADASRQVKRELSLADKYKKPVFWLRVEKVEPNNLSYFLTATQWLDWLDSRDDTLEKLVQDLQADFAEQSVNFAENSTLHQEHPVEKPGRTATWAKGVLAFPTDREAAECAAWVYFLLAHQEPDSSVILPTGRSATQIFRAMLRIVDQYDDCPFGEAPILSDTETFGVWSEHETSRTNHINTMLIQPLQRKHKAPSKEQLHLLSGVYMESDPLLSAQKVLRMYPPSVHAVSLSPVGEILAYEVGTYTDAEEILDDGPRIVEVGEHSKKYIDPNQPSKSITTIGLGTALSASTLLILAFDIQKANILKRMFTGTVTAGIPATLLRNHPNAYILTTEKVAHEAQIDDLVSDKKDAKEAANWIITQ